MSKARSTLLLFAVIFLAVSNLFWKTIPQVHLTINNHETIIRRHFSWETDDFDLTDLFQLSKSRFIPLILHQSWKTKQLTQRFSTLRKEWTKTNPELRQILWTDEDNALFVELFYPQLLSIYNNLPGAIFKADCMRYLYLHLFGGVYADLDVFPIENIQPLFKGHENHIVLAEISADKEWDNNIPNAFMASRPGNPFWQYVWVNIVKKVGEGQTRAEYLTGPVTLYDSVNSWYLRNDTIYLIEPGLVYGEDWREPSEVCLAAKNDLSLLPECLKLHPKIKILTIWTHTW